ncbi:MAG: flagellin [Methyloligellaceae bacterium]
MFDVTLSSPVRSNLLALQDTSSDLAKTQARLATGLLVATALDNPTAFFTAQSLSNRAGDLNRLLDSVGLAEQTLQAASAGIDAITSLVESAQGIANQALASSGTTAVVTGTQTLTGDTTLDTLNFANGDTVEITTNSGTTTFTVTNAATQTVDNLIAGLAVNTTATVTLSSGNIRIEATDGGNLTLGEGAQGTNLDDLGLSVGTTAASVNTTRQALAASFDTLRTQIDQLAADAGFNGVNLLNGQDLAVTLNEDGTSTLTVDGVTLTAAGLGVSASTNGFQDDASISAALTELGDALTTLRSQASTLGTDLSALGTRESFAKSLANTLEAAAADLTIADTNEESAKLLALQTRQQLAFAALSISSSSEQNVLSLL